MTKSTKEYQQQYVVLHARIKYREKAIQGFKQHLKNGTYPKRFKSLKPYPAMDTPESQTIVNQACQQADQVILDQRIQDYERKLQQDRASLQSLKEARREERQQHKTRKVEPTVLQLQQELRDLRSMYKELSQKVEPRPPES